MMDASARYSAGTSVTDTAMGETIEAVDSHWISPFRATVSIQVDRAFDVQYPISVSSYLSPYF